MTTKKSKKQNNINESLAYYLLRIAQRFSLLFLGLVTFAYWALLISVTVTISFAAENSQRLPSTINSLAEQSLSGVKGVLVIWAIASACVTVMLLLIPRVKKYEKRLISDSAVYIIFCILAVLFADSIVRNFLVKLIV